MNQNNRLYFLDWIRIFAFFVLIFYHTGMYNALGTLLTVNFKKTLLSQ